MVPIISGLLLRLIISGRILRRKGKPVAQRELGQGRKLCAIARLRFCKVFDRCAVRAEHVRREDRRWIYGKHIFRDVVADEASARKDFRSFDVAIDAVVASFESRAVVVV